MNKIILSGRLIDDPEVRYVGDDSTCVAHFSLAVSKGFSSDAGADFINHITVWNKQAENVGKYLHKGDMAIVEGRLHNDNYTDKEGKTVYRDRVTASFVEFLPKANNNNNNSNNSNNDDIKPSDFKTEKVEESEKDPFKDFGKDVEININEDELPF